FRDNLVISVATLRVGFVASRRDGGAYARASSSPHGRRAGSSDAAGAAALSVPGRGGSPLDHFLDRLADGRRPLWARPGDGVRHARSVWRDLVPVVQPRAPVACQRGDPRVAVDDVLRRALLHAPAARRYARDVER